MNNWCYHDFIISAYTWSTPRVQTGNPVPRVPPRRCAMWARRPALAHHSLSYYPMDPSARVASYCAYPAPNSARAATTRPHIP